MTELLLYIGQCACVVGDKTVGVGGVVSGHGMEMNLVKEDLIDFRDLVDALHDDLPELVFDNTFTNNKLRLQGQVWAQHISEGWRVSVLSGAYILFAVISGYPIFHSLLYLPTHSTPAFYIARVFDGILFIFLPKIFSYLLRLIERRTIFARHGKRSLVICDVPWVHQLLENYVSKLFALSYGPISLEVHGKFVSRN